MVKYWKKLGHEKLGSGEETDNLTIEWSGTYPSIKVIGTLLASELTPTTTSSGGTLNITSGGSTVLSTISVGSASDTAWVLRFKLNFATWATSSYFHVCLSDNDNPITSSQDELGVLWRNDGGSGNNFGVHTVAGANPNSVNSQDQEVWTTATGTDYYFEIIRTSSTTATVNRYTDSTYSTVAEDSSGTVSASCGGLDRIKIMANNASDTTGAVTVSDIKFYNAGYGVSTTTAYGTGTVAEGNTGAGSAIANMYSTGNAPIGNLIIGCIFNCRITDNSQSHLLYATIYNSAGVLQDRSTNGINTNSLSTSTYTVMTFTFGGEYTLVDGDRIALFNTGENNLRQAQESGSSMSPAMEEYQSGSWNGENTSYQIKQSVIWKTPPITTSDTILTFTESGTFTPAGTFDVEYLVVGGGGSGGFWLGGGGGAGAYRAN